MSKKHKRSDPTHIYVAQCQQYLKIGVTNSDLSKRMAALQNGNPHRVVPIYFEISNDPYSVESLVLERFSRNRVVGEWLEGVTLAEVKAVLREIEESTPGYSKPAMPVAPEVPSTPLVEQVADYLDGADTVAISEIVDALLPAELPRRAAEMAAARVLGHLGYVRKRIILSDGAKQWRYAKRFH